MNNHLLHKASVAASPAVVPASYVVSYDFLTDPMKLTGFIVLILQGVLVGVKIWKELRSRKVADENAS